MLVNRYAYGIADSTFITLLAYEYCCGSVRPLDTDGRAGWVLKSPLASPVSPVRYLSRITTGLYSAEMYHRPLFFCKQKLCFEINRVGKYQNQAGQW